MRKGDLTENETSLLDPGFRTAATHATPRISKPVISCGWQVILGRMYIFDQLAEARIEEAISRGELDNLAGKGRPLRLDDDKNIPEEYRMAYRILKCAGIVPPEVELRNRINALQESISGNLDDVNKSMALKKLHCLYIQLDNTRNRQANLAIQEEYYRKVLGKFS